MTPSVRGQKIEQNVFDLSVAQLKTVVDQIALQMKILDYKVMITIT